MGVFKYDIYPGMSVLPIIGWDEDGDVQIEGGFGMKGSSLIAVFSKKQGEEIIGCLQILKQRVNQQIDKIRKEALEDFFEKYPELERAGERQENK